MSITTGLAIYFIVWWVVLFAVLPWGIRSQTEAGVVSPGTDPGAPIVAALLKRLVWTTAVAAILFAAGSTLYLERIVTLEDLATLWGLLR